MRTLLWLASLAVPALMLLAAWRWRHMRVFFNVCALLAALLFGNIAARSIYEIIRDGTVFMTKIHAVFLNDTFLVSGAYLGVYGIYVLMEQLVGTIRGRD